MGQQPPSQCIARLLRHTARPQWIWARPGTQAASAPTRTWCARACAGGPSPVHGAAALCRHAQRGTPHLLRDGEAGGRVCGDEPHPDAGDDRSRHHVRPHGGQCTGRCPLMWPSATTTDRGQQIDMAHGLVESHESALLAAVAACWSGGQPFRRRLQHATPRHQRYGDTALHSILCNALRRLLLLLLLWLHCVSTSSMSGVHGCVSRVCARALGYTTAAHSGTLFEGGVRSASFLWKADLPGAARGSTYRGLMHVVSPPDAALPGTHGAIYLLCALHGTSPCKSQALCERSGCLICEGWICSHAPHQIWCVCVRAAAPMACPRLN
jgi:hypothetical protein